MPTVEATKKWELKVDICEIAVAAILLSGAVCALRWKCWSLGMVVVGLANVAFLSFVFSAAVKSTPPEKRMVPFEEPVPLPTRFAALVVLPAGIASIIIGFAAIYLSMGSASFKLPDNTTFEWIDALYFSMVTFTTVGYGDIVPQLSNAKWAVMMELLSAFISLLTAVPILIARLVTFPP